MLRKNAELEEQNEQYMFLLTVKEMKERFHGYGFDQASTNGMLCCWNAALLECYAIECYAYWNAMLLECYAYWNAVLLECGAIGMPCQLECGAVGMQCVFEHHDIGTIRYWNAVLLECYAIGMLR